MANKSPIVLKGAMLIPSTTFAKLSELHRRLGALEERVAVAEETTRRLGLAVLGPLKHLPQGSAVQSVRPRRRRKPGK